MGAWWRGGGLRGGRPLEALSIGRQPLRVRVQLDRNKLGILINYIATSRI
jgi:hypothetical protein